MNAKSKFGVEDHVVQHILAQATEDDLQRFRNPVYMALCSQVNKMQGQIETQQ
jgi:hypothetical protein